MNLASKLQNPSGPTPELEVIGKSSSASGPHEQMIMDRDTLGRLRRELIWTVGENRMRGIMARIGFSSGYSHFLRNEFPSSLLSDSKGSIKKFDLKESQDEFTFEATDSFEALEHLRFFFPTVKDPQCSLLAGYLSGAITGQQKEPIYFLEIQCVAKKDSCCRFIGKRKSDWDEKDQPALRLYTEDNMNLELSETKEQLKQTKNRYQNLFEQSSLPIFILDTETGAFLDVNVAADELTGFPHKSLLSMNIFDIHPTEEHHKLANYLKTILADEWIDNQELTLIRKDGNRRTVAVSGKALSYGGQKVIQMIFRDITDLKESETKEKSLSQQLIRSERLSSIGRLAASVAHELKNPLGAIRNAIYFIRTALDPQEHYQKDTQLKKIVKLAESEVDASVRIIEDLLDFARVVELIPRNTQINNLLEEIPQIVTIPENVQLKMDLDVTLPSAKVDPERLNQVFHNIVGNAIQAMPKGGTLTIKSRLEIQTGGKGAGKKELIAIAFEDTGQGIEPVHLPKIFEPLFTTKARGTGLGLAISGNLIDKHGGVIQVQSQVGKGTKFTIRLPLKPPSETEDNNYEQRPNSSR